MILLWTRKPNVYWACTICQALLVQYNEHSRQSPYCQEVYTLVVRKRQYIIYVNRWQKLWTKIKKFKGLRGWASRYRVVWEGLCPNRGLLGGTRTRQEAPGWLIIAGLQVPAGWVVRSQHVSAGWVVHSQHNIFFWLGLSEIWQAQGSDRIGIK